MQTGQQWNRRAEPKSIPARSRQIDAALYREEKFDAIQQLIGPEGDVYLRATDVEWDRHILAIRVRELEGYEQKYAEILGRCRNDKSHGCWCGVHTSETMEDGK